MNTNNTYTDWYDKALYDLPMQALDYSHLPFYGPSAGLDGQNIEYNGELFRGDDTVVVGGHIGNIERANLDEKVVGLGLSYDYDMCMKNPEDVNMHWCSGFRFKIDGMRHATAEEVERYNKAANFTCRVVDR